MRINISVSGDSEVEARINARALVDEYDFGSEYGNAVDSLPEKLKQPLSYKYSVYGNVYTIKGKKLTCIGYLRVRGGNRTLIVTDGKSAKKLAEKHVAYEVGMPKISYEEMVALRTKLWK